MPRGKLPIGFGRTLKALYTQGYDRKTAFKEAWKIHKGKGPGMHRRQQPQKYLTNRRRKQNPIAIYNPGTRRTKCPTCGSLCEPGQKYHPGCEPAPSSSGRKAGAIPSYRHLKLVKKNPGGTRLPLKNIEIRYQRAGGEYQGQWFRHPFKSSVTVIGLANGSILIRSNSGKKLWGTV